MSWTKRYFEELIERLEKAFPELTFDEIVTAMTESNNADETLFKCMFEAEKSKTPYKVNDNQIKFKVVVKRYSQNPLLRCTKVFTSKETMDDFVNALLEYVDNSIDEYEWLTVGDMKEFLNLRNDIEFSDYGHGWKDSAAIISYSIHEYKKIIEFDKPVSIP